MTASSTPHQIPRLVSILSSKVVDAIQDLLSTKAGLVPRSGAQSSGKIEEAKRARHIEPNLPKVFRPSHN